MATHLALVESRISCLAKLATIDIAVHEDALFNFSLVDERQVDVIMRLDLFPFLFADQVVYSLGKDFSLAFVRD